MEEEIQRKFKVGDLVQLKTGSRIRMTVEGYINVFNSDFRIFKERDMEVECSWFQNDEKKFRTFHEDDLELVQ